MRQALDLGINFFDTANVYSGGESEAVLGRFLKANTRREAVVIATKVHGVMREEPNGRGLSRKAILFELDQSLKRLETDYVDLYQIHRWDYETPIEETLEALHDVVKAGKVRYIGASSMYAWQFAKALYLADLPRMDALRLHAEPLQPALSRRGARDDRAVPSGRRGRHSLEPAGARASDARLEIRNHGAKRDGRFWQRDVRTHRGGGPQSRRSAGRDRREARRSAGAGGDGMAAGKACRDCADCGRDQAESSRRRRCSSWPFSSPTEEMTALEEPYVPHPVLGFS